MSQLELVTLIIAVYGAVLSTAGLIRQHNLDRPRIRVTMSSLLPVGGARLSAAYVSIRAVNHGQRQAVVDTITIELPDRRTLALVSGVGTFLPAVLQQGEGAQLNVPYADIGGGLMLSNFGERVKIRPICHDSLGRTHRGKAWVITPAEWAKM